MLNQLDYKESKGNLALIQSENHEIHLIAVFGEVNDHSIQKLDLKNLASTISLNGPVSSLKEEFQFNLNSPEAKAELQKLIEKLENEGIKLDMLKSVFILHLNINLTRLQLPSLQDL